MTTGGQHFQVRIHGLSNGTAFVVGERQPRSALIYDILVDVPRIRYFVLAWTSLIASG
jgi:hypothetical protein